MKKPTRQWLLPTPPSTAPCHQGWPVGPGLCTSPRRPDVPLLQNSCWWSSLGGWAGCWGPCRELCLQSEALGGSSTTLWLRGVGLRSWEGGCLGWGAGGPSVAVHVSVLKVEGKQAWWGLLYASCWSCRGWRVFDRKKRKSKKKMLLIQRATIKNRLQKIRKTRL